MLVQQVQQGRELIQCPSCQRILYFDPSEQPAEEASQEEQSG
jgi:predicted  nucleic acid-binding Zn-ribbon protein